MISRARLVVFDDGWPVPPFTMTRPALDLRCGALRLWEKVAVGLRRHVEVLVQDHWRAVMTERDKEITIPTQPVGTMTYYVNGRVLNADQVLAGMDGSQEIVLTDRGRVLAARLGPIRSVLFEGAIRAGLPVDEAVEDLPEIELAGQWLEHTWDLIAFNAAELVADWHRMGESVSLGEVHPTATVYRPDRVRIDEGARVEAGAVLDAREGPIWLGSAAIVNPLAYVQGPAAIGSGAQVMSGARIREGSSLGPGCRVGGEVEESIFFAHSNKYHDGFVGHSAIGSWCNLGALTTTSDLKNTYGTIRLEIDGQTIETGQIKLGSFIGDHVRLGIGTLLTSGCVIGPASNLFGGGLLPKSIPAFRWGGSDNLERYDPDRFFATAATAMGRRGMTLGPAERAILAALSLPDAATL